jgi:hypothetical protein
MGRRAKKPMIVSKAKIKTRIEMIRPIMAQILPAFTLLRELSVKLLGCALNRKSSFLANDNVTMLNTIPTIEIMCHQQNTSERMPSTRMVFELGRFI